MQTVLETTLGDVPAYIAESESNVALLIIPSMFGIDDDLVLLCEDIAFEGYTVIAADLFWEIDPGPLGHSTEEVRRAIARKNELDKDEALENIFAFCAAAQALAKDVVVLGIGFGGQLAYRALAHGKISAAVTWHAAGIADKLTLSGKIDRPLSLHFGEEDILTPSFEIDILKEIFRENERVDIAVYPSARHGYSYRAEPTFNAEAFDGSFAALLGLLQQFS